MKFCQTVGIICLSLFLASCSLAQDITPPPGYQSPTPVQSLATVTPAAQATLTSGPATVTSDISPTAVSTSSTLTPAASLGNINGNLVNGSGGSIPQNQTVTLFGYDKDQSGTYQKTVELSAQIESNGSYEFRGIDIPQGRAFIIITSWGGVEFQSDPIIISDSTTEFSLPITVYEKSEDINVLSASQVHLIFNSSAQDLLQVTELFIVTNLGKQVVVVPSDGSTISFIHVPKDAGSVQFQLSQGSAELLNATGGFAMAPGAEKQYGFIATYSLPYNRSLKFELPFSIPVASLTVFIPQGMKIRSEQLSDAGTQDIQGASYQMYQANNMASGSSLTLTLSGQPGASTGFKFTQQTWTLIGIALIGIILIGLGVFLFLHDRNRYRRENEPVEEIVPEDALGDDRNNIMDAMIAPDDKYKAGEIPKEAYEKRRFELKERLKEAL